MEISKNQWRTTGGVAISTDKTTFFNDLDYKADNGQHFYKSEKSARRRYSHKIIKTNL
jgi:hypothetical protein